MAKAKASSVRGAAGRHLHRDRMEQGPAVLGARFEEAAHLLARAAEAGGDGVAEGGAMVAHLDDVRRHALELVRFLGDLGDQDALRHRRSLGIGAHISALMLASPGYRRAPAMGPSQDRGERET
jgi:hypothetical protein